MGKTALATAALHDPRVIDKYPSSYFISCDSSHTIDSLVAMIASNIGLEASTGLTQAVIHRLSTGPPSLVVLDNFETPWEPVEGRAKVEEFLSLMTDVPHVALLVWLSHASWYRYSLQILSSRCVEPKGPEKSNGVIHS